MRTRRFIGKNRMNAEHKKDMANIFYGVKGAGMLDYVTAWYIKAAKYLQQHNSISKIDASTRLAMTTPQSLTKAASVSANAISQGELVGIVWNELFKHYKIKILFAHRTFSWKNEASGNAAVHVVIIWFGNFDVAGKKIYCAFAIPRVRSYQSLRS